MAYWAIGTQQRKWQNLLLLAASYVFYGLWDWRFLFLLIGSSLVDFFIGLALHKSEKSLNRKFLVALSLCSNLGILFVFKYFNFFLDGFSSFFLSGNSNYQSLWEVIIPVGLSFYTFQTLSYTIDVYRKNQKPTKSILDFLCFVSFFPQLVAGPIERAKQLLPQFANKRAFNLKQSKEGLRMILWGLFKKILVADKLGVAVTMVFNEPENYGSVMLLYAGFLFSFQLYCDFSGYVDIARGTAKLFGFELSRNFKIFYLSRSLSDFWVRWHITLTKWFTDYVYIPYMKLFKNRNNMIRWSGLLITMGLVGLWHGANWTFVAFGLYSGVIMLLERIPWGHRKNTIRNKLQNIPMLFNSAYIMMHFTVASIFFRSEHIHESLAIFQRIFTLTPDVRYSSLIGLKLLYFVFFIAAELLTRNKEYPLQDLELKVPKIVRWAFYYVLIFLMIRYVETDQAFIYFQF